MKKGLLSLAVAILLTVSGCSSQRQTATQPTDAVDGDVGFDLSATAGGEAEAVWSDDSGVLWRARFSKTWKRTVTGDDYDPDKQYTLTVSPVDGDSTGDDSADVSCRVVRMERLVDDKSGKSATCTVPAWETWSKRLNDGDYPLVTE
ncbi:hypothetical protein [Bifidobacterium leontopitheci]|uniref:Ig-like domain-containing protein n=1 Tax=Bifidobacterium leontopitheci TaxID=2650774 RepID=A0A6I1GJV6_9BIFI|nr:hypothetical protein [Bifidobacterium leontopitheci]KAB7789647.1 hypothetical protein F7D09_1854 [Bifidobacterium leontopitheci]